MEPSNAERDLNDYQHMDQALKTVETQLLNVSGPEEKLPSNEETKTEKLESKLGLLIRKAESLKREIPASRENINNNQNMKIGSVDTVGMTFGRFGNSKYNYFESSHPGQAMAMTEEELEKEFASTRHTTAYKHKPTTTGGISTWILLNPPSTTLNPGASVKDQETSKFEEIKSTWKPIKPTPTTANIDTTLRADMKTTASMEKTPQIQSSTSKSIGTMKQSSTTSKMEKMTTKVDSHTTPRIETTESNRLETTPTLTKSSTARSDNDDGTTTLKTTTKRIVSSSRTPRPSITNPNTTTVVSKATTIKVVRPSRPSKPAIIRKSSAKPEGVKATVNATSKVEKVTFRPVQMIATPKNPVQPPKPMFVTKIQASLQTDPNVNVSKSSAASSTLKKEDPKTSVESSERVQVTMKSKPPKPNNVLKVQLKKPTQDSVTTIEIEPIKVNAPILTIERVEESKKDNKLNANKPIALDDSKIDVKFDFNPELTRIIETSTQSSTTTTTTKKPKHKRKKNKVRRRKPSSTTPTFISSSLATLNIDLNNNEESLTEAEANEISLQESKIVPDSQVSSNTTKNKKKQVQKPIGTQIYNFLSREVMPSFGVMSLVGLGLGLASYFLYPFGGTIARRNGYEVEPNYKYNLEEYGGNYGQNEEEVFSKVLQGMTPADKKYGGMKDYENNYYRYQAYDGAYTDPYTTRRGDTRYPTSAVPVYRPEKTPLPYDIKYRNTEFKYPDLPTTPNYYEIPTQPEFLNNQGAADRQFVVGNVPKEYSYEEKRLPVLSTTTESLQTDFGKQIAQNLRFVVNPVNVPPSFGQAAAQTLKTNEGYEEIEITPTAVAVEHGPRSLKIEKSDESAVKVDSEETAKTRRKRDSNIQFIPPRSELEKAEEEEDLSNEILDIIDSAIPTKDPDMIKHTTTMKRDELRASENGEKKKEEEDDKKKKTVVKPSEKVTISMVDEVTKKAEEIEAEDLDGIMKTSTTISSPTTTTDKSTSSASADGLNTSAGKVDLKTPESTTFSTTTQKPVHTNFNLFDFVRKIAEIKFRVGLTVLKHASEGFAKYLGNVQKKLNGEE